MLLPILKFLFASLLVYSVFYYFVNIYLAVEYVVHKQGAIFITGTSTGIGNHAAISFVNEGYDVFATIRKLEEAKNLLEPLKEEEAKKRMQVILLDVTNEKDIQKAFSEVSDFLNKTNKPLVGIVNNAGISGTLPAEFITSEWLQKVFKVNVFGKKNRHQVLYISPSFQMQKVL